MAKTYSVVLDVLRIPMIKMPLSVIFAILAIVILFVLAVYFVPPLAIGAAAVSVLIVAGMRIMQYFMDGK